MKMATINRLYVFITCILSGIGVLLSVVSIATEHWVYADKAVSPDSIVLQSVTYGLFEGTLKMYSPVASARPITMTCLAKENACAYLCAKDKDSRYSLLQDLYDNKEGLDEKDCPTIILNTQYYNPEIAAVDNSTTTNRKFINCGVWVSTILFLVISMVFGAVSSALSMYNTVINPVQVYLSIYGIFVYNGVAAVSLIIAMLLWGIMYNVSIFHDIAIFYTLYGKMNTDKNAILGYSYWLNIAPILLYISSICALYLRQYFITKDPGHKIVQREDDGDPVIYLY